MLSLGKLDTNEESLLLSYISGSSSPMALIKKGLGSQMIQDRLRGCAKSNIDKNVKKNVMQEVEVTKAMFGL